MKHKFKLSDLPILIKNDRRFQIGLGVILLIFLWPLIDPTKNNKHVGPPRLQAPAEPGTGRVAQDEATKDLINAFQGELKDTREAVTNVNKQVQDLAERQSQDRDRTAEIFRRVLERVGESQTGPQGGYVDHGVAPTDLAEGAGVQPVSLDVGGLETFGDTGDKLTTPLPPAPKRVAFIGRGDSVRVKLLSGVTAPTDGTPYPVVLKLVGDVLGPDGQALPLGEGRMIAAAQGSLTDSRALFRLTSLNIRLPDGRRKEVEADGWIVGEDGLQGMPGVLIDPIGAAIAGGAMTGALAGVGEGLSASQTSTYSGFGGASTVVTGDIAQFAAGRGVSRAARTWEEIIKDRLDLLVPVVQVLSNREGTAVFSKSVEIPDLYDSLGAEESTFDSLD